MNTALVAHEAHALITDSTKSYYVLIIRKYSPEINLD